VFQAGFNTKVGVWKIQTGEKTGEFDEQGWLREYVAISPNGRFLAMIPKGGRLKIADLSEKKVAAEVDIPPAEQPGRPGEVGDVKGLAFSPDGALLGGNLQHRGKTRLIVWDMATGNTVQDQLLTERIDAGFAGPGLDWAPDSSGWLIGRQLVDRQSLRPVFQLPDMRMEDALHRMLSKDSVLVCSRPMNGRVNIRGLALPRAEITKATAIVRDGGKSVDAGLPPLTKADWSGAREIAPSTEPLKGALAADAAGRATKKFATSIQLKRPAGPLRPGEHHVRGVFFASPAVGQAIVANQFGGSPLGRLTRDLQGVRVWADRIDLVAGTTLNSIELPPVAEVLDLSADGTQLVARVVEERVDVWTTAGAGKHVVGFRPFEKEEGDGQHVVWARFVDSQNVLVAGKRGRLVLFKIPQCQAVYAMKMAGLSRPALSPGRQYGAVSTDKGIAIFNALSGQTVGMLAARAGWLAVLAFSPDCTMLGMCDTVSQNATLTAYDLKTGNVAAEVILPTQAREHSIDFVSAGYIVAGKALLVDVERAMVVWQFETSPLDRSEVGDIDENYWFITAERDKLAHLALPHEEARKAVASLKSEDLAVRPGVKVSVDVNTTTNDPAIRKRVIDSLSNRLQANGLVVAEGQPLRLVASVGTRPGKEVTYKTIGRLGAQKIVTTVYEARLAFEIEGKTAWECKQTGDNASMFVHMKEGEDLTTVLQSGVPEMGVGLFMGASIPKIVPKPRDMVGFGYSRLTSSGPVAAQPRKPN
jgi:hypothetical protein